MLRWQQGWRRDSTYAKLSAGGWRRDSTYAKVAAGGWRRDSTYAKVSAGGRRRDSTYAKVSAGGWRRDSTYAKVSAGGWRRDSTYAKVSAGGRRRDSTYAKVNLLLLILSLANHWLLVMLQVKQRMRPNMWCLYGDIKENILFANIPFWELEDHHDVDMGPAHQAPQSKSFTYFIATCLRNNFLLAN